MNGHRPEQSAEPPGRVTVVRGAVVEVQFPGELPAVNEALRVDIDGREIVLEVVLHLDLQTVRALAMEPVAGLARIALYRVAVQMLTSEQAARLVAMDAATRSAERMADSLRAQESRARQEQVTAGVLELIAARFASDRPRRSKVWTTPAEP